MVSCQKYLVFQNDSFWCSKCFDTTKRVIQFGEVGFPLVILSHISFQKMLRLPKPTKYLKLIEANYFIANNGGPKIIL